MPQWLGGTQYTWWLVLVALLVGTVITAWWLTFQVPVADNSVVAIEWLWCHQYLGMLGYYALIGALVVVSFVSFTRPGVVNLDSPLSQPGIFVVSAAFLLLSAFYIGETPTGARRVDTHPLVLLTVLVFLMLALSTAAVNAMKRFDDGDNYPRGLRKNLT